jgi:hypothetical protein
MVGVEIYFEHDLNGCTGGVSSDKLALLEVLQELSLQICCSCSLAALSASRELTLVDLRSCRECLQSRTHLQNSRSVTNVSYGPVMVTVHANS